MIALPAVRSWLPPFLRLELYEARLEGLLEFEKLVAPKLPEDDDQSRTLRFRAR